MPVRLGAVDYLNVRPLVRGLDSDPHFTLRFDPPSQCARLLHDGEIDLGMIPTIAYQHRPGYRVVPGVAIGSEGPVASVALYTRIPLKQITRVAADTSSNTSVALLRVLSAERFGISPELVPAPPNLRDMTASLNAALLIGDPSLFTDHTALGLEKIDLGEEWTAHTGLPFIWAFWAGREGAVDGEGVTRLQQARGRGEAEVDAIGAEYAAGYEARTGIPSPPDVAQRYLRENMKYDLGDREVEAVRRFHAGARRLGIVDRDEPIRFF